MNEKPQIRKMPVDKNVGSENIGRYRSLKEFLAMSNEEFSALPEWETEWFHQPMSSENSCEPYDREEHD